jgi:uncharacterized protein
MGNVEHGKGYDAKNMMHTIRLLQVAEEIGRDGQLHVRRTNREALLFIKSGDFPYDELLGLADELVERIETVYQKSALPETPDRKKLEAVLVEMRTELYQ